MVRPVGAADSRPYGVPPGLGPYGMVRLVPSSVTGFARATFPVGEGDLRRGTKPSPGRGWLGEAETGVGRYEPGPGAALLPALRGRTVHPGLPWPSGCIPSSVTGFARATFPVGEGFLRRGTKPSPGRGWLGEAETGAGRYEPGPGAAPLPALGATFPQGKVGGIFFEKLQNLC